MKVLIYATFVTALLLSGCESGSPEPEAEATGGESNEEGAQAPSGESNEAATEAPSEPATEAPSEPATEAPSEPEEAYTPGNAGVRVVNLLAGAVDIYVRTTGRVRAFSKQEGLAPNGVSEFFFPPEGGHLLVTTAGAGNATCVGRCEHFIAQTRVYPEEGNAQTVVLYDDDGRQMGTALWENPTPERQEGSSNAMAAPNAERALFVVSTNALRDARFGLHLGFQGVEGCQGPSNSSNALVGGTQTPAFVYDPGSVEVLLYDSSDRTCSADPVGGPFIVTGGAAERSHLMLHGAPGSMQAVVLPMSSVTGPQ